MATHGSRAPYEVSTVMISRAVRRGQRTLVRLLVVAAFIGAVGTFVWFVVITRLLFAAPAPRGSRAVRGATTIAARADSVDLSGAWVLTFRVLARGEIRDSTRAPTTDSATGRLRLAAFKAPPPDPRYEQSPDWPRWRGVIHAPFLTFLQVPPLPIGMKRHLTQDSLRVGAWLDSAGVRLWIEGGACADCGSISARGRLRTDRVDGTWRQEFFGPGDSGTFTMRRAP